MKRLLFTAVVMAGLYLPAVAQEQKEEKEVKENLDKTKKESREIIIRDKGDKEINLTVEIKGDKITVNGKPLAEFKEEGVTINKRKMTIRGGGDNMVFNREGDPAMFEKDFMQNWQGAAMISKPFLGVTTEKTEKGARIMEVVKESAAEKAGLKKEDVITSVGDKIVSDPESLSALIGDSKPKATVNISYLRNGKSNTAKVTLGERKVNSAMAYAPGKPRVKVRSFAHPKIGNPDMELFGEDALNGLLAPGASTYGFSPYSFPRQKRLGLKIQDTEEGGNIKVIEVEEGSAAEKAGLKKDDIITEIAGKKVGNTDEAREQLNPEESKSSYTIKALRNGTAMNFEIKIPKKLKTANL